MPFITNEQLKMAIQAIRQQDWADDYPKNADDMLEALLDQPENEQCVDKSVEWAAVKKPIFVMSDDTAPKLSQDTQTLQDGISGFWLKNKR